MKNIIFLLVCCLTISICFSQNVGIANTSPTEKLHVDSGSIKIGKQVWNAIAPKMYLKFGDGDFVTMGEEEADDKLTIRGKELLLRPSLSYSTIPVSIQGSVNYSHFYFGSNEDTYIRAGKNNSSVIINDITGGRVGIGMSNPARAGLEQNGVGVSGNTAALFGGEAQGVSIQRNWPAIGFNHWYDGVNHKSIGTGYAGQLAVNPANGSLQYAAWNTNAVIPDAQLNVFPQSLIQRFYITRFGKVGIGTDNPATSLHIKGGDEYARLRLEDDIVPCSWEMYPVAFPIVDGLFREDALCFHRPGTPVIQACIDYDGTYYYDSDSSVKKNIHYLSGETFLGRLMQLKPAIYNMKEDPAGVRRSYGFISQDVEMIFPEVVKNANGVKLMGYTKLIPILTKTIQEQQQQIESLEKRIEQLERIIR